jgi:hypothetical protein
MNDKELQVKRFECDVRTQETKVRDAKRALDLGYKKLCSEFERDYEKLKSDYEREVLFLQREMAYLENAKEAAAKGFES